MRLAIISLPLHVNYGGILQSYALKKELESMGHEVVVIDRKVKMPFPKWWKAPLIYMNRALKCHNVLGLTCIKKTAKQLMPHQLTNLFSV